MDKDVIVIIWFIAGIVLIIAEFVNPVMILIFFGIAAIITGGLIQLGMPHNSSIPVLTFATVSLTLLLTLRRFAKKMFRGSTADIGNSESIFEDIIGAEGVVTSGFMGTSQRGRIELRGAEWEATCDHPLKSGDRVEIQCRKNSVLVVYKL